MNKLHKYIKENEILFNKFLHILRIISIICFVVFEGFFITRKFAIISILLLVIILINLLTYNLITYLKNKEIITKEDDLHIY